MGRVTVISLGGSIVAPDGVDCEFLRAFCALIAGEAQAGDRRLALVIGGGALARRYQSAYRETLGESGDDEAGDRIGIAATRVNAQVVKEVLGKLAPDPVVTDPEHDEARGSVVVAGGWKPGFSTDNVAVTLAIRFGAESVVNLSNIAKVYTADPKLDADASPIDHSGWNAFLQITGTTWRPGANTPFDPVAATRAAEAGLRVIVADGRNLENVASILRGQRFEGTVIGPNR